MKYEYFSKIILKDKSLTDATKIVANYLIHIAGWEEDNILPSMNTLSDLVSVNKSQVVAAINQLKEKKYIIVNNDNTFTFQINGVKFEKQDLSKPDVCHMFGDFVKAPMELLCNDLATPSTRIAAIMFFEWNFDIDEKGNYSIKRKKVQIDAVATYYGINKSTFKHRIQKAKKAELLCYETIKVGKEETIIVNAKVNRLVRIWTTVDSLAAKKSMKLAEEAREESVNEEQEEIYEGTGENKAVYTGSTIEQLLDYEAKNLSDKQVYIGCFVAGVKNYLSDMIEIKGKDYAMSYMKEHWSKIDLSKVL
jgi:hypothetical protein